MQGILRYIKNESQRGKRLFGGIVINTDSRKFTGRWIYFNKSKKDLKDNNFDNWEDLEL
jgi:hypothetical protein